MKVLQKYIINIIKYYILLKSNIVVDIAAGQHLSAVIGWPDPKN